MKATSAKDGLLARQAALEPGFRDGSPLSPDDSKEPNGRRFRLAEIRSQIKTGTYHVDSSRIAAKLMDEMSEVRSQSDRLSKRSDRVRG